jgi:hypothetical protein
MSPDGCRADPGPARSYGRGSAGGAWRLWSYAGQRRTPRCPLCEAYHYFDHDADDEHDDQHHRDDDQHHHDDDQHHRDDD